MSRYYTYLTLILAATVLISLTAATPLAAADHVVAPGVIAQALTKSEAGRQNEIAQVQKFFSSQPARDALKKGGIDLREVQSAIPSLDNQELAQLARKTSKLQSDFAAGALTNERLTYIVIALAVAVIVILIFEA